MLAPSPSPPSISRLSRSSFNIIALIIPATAVELLFIHCGLGNRRPRLLAMVFKRTVRRSMRRTPVPDLVSHARSLAIQHEEAARSFPNPLQPLAALMIEAHSHTAKYCRGLYDSVAVPTE